MTIEELLIGGLAILGWSVATAWVLARLGIVKVVGITRQPEGKSGE